MTAGLNGAELTGRYHAEVVAPLMVAHFPDLPHAVARIGSGSDVLGLDDAYSRDHDWGLRLNVLVDDAHVEVVDTVLQRELPQTWNGHPVAFATSWDPQVRARAEVSTPRAFTRFRTGIDPLAGMSTDDWLQLTGQAVLEITAGPVFVDTSGELTEIRRLLRWVPDDIWRHQVAADWERIGQEFSFIARTALVGDDLGSRVITARAVGALMHLGFRLERQWAPYSKWLGSGFARLPRASVVAPDLARALAADAWPEREQALVDALRVLARLQGEVGLPTRDPIDPPPPTRPHRWVAPVAALVRESIEDPEIRALELGRGSPEQWISTVNVLVDAEARGAAVRSWTTGAGPVSSSD